MSSGGVSLLGEGTLQRTWFLVHRPVIAVAVIAAVLGALIAPETISARSASLSGPSFSTAILMPCLGSTLGLYLALPISAGLEDIAVRRMLVWRTIQGLASLAVAYASVLPAAIVATGDARRILQNVAVFTAGALLAARLIHPIAGVALPWLWSLGALIFGLSSSDIGRQRWAWWAWIIGDSPQVVIPLALCLATIVLLAGLRPRQYPAQKAARGKAAD